jgi:nitrogen regulatory protein P-II 2
MRSIETHTGVDPIMKMIRAIIQPYRLEQVREALNRIGIHGMTVYQAQGFGRQRGHTEIYRGAEYQVAFRPKLAVDVALEDGQVEAGIDAIIGAARSGEIGDGKIFVLAIDEAIRIRTGERNENAL